MIILKDEAMLSLKVVSSEDKMLPKILSIMFVDSLEDYVEAVELRQRRCPTNMLTEILGRLKCDIMPDFAGICIKILKESKL